MKTIVRIFSTTCAAVLLVAPFSARAQVPSPPPQEVRPAPQSEVSFQVSGRYTAQRRPRVTVLDFEDTNAAASEARYGASVQAMLVTFLKRKSQFVVVERQKLGPVLAEWQRNQKGLTNLQPQDPNARELLEKLDAIILGNVTLLNIETEVQTAEPVAPRRGGAKKPGDADVPPPPDNEDGTEKPQQQQPIRGPRIEVDAKLLSRADGRIIAAAQRSGPVACLRSIIERLGIALEQEYLRPYYGKLKINLTDPENVRVFLTPILLDTALDEEKPPVEASATVKIGGDRDLVELWTTDPTTYVIENLLSGWYSMRLERPGYEGLGTNNANWEARNTGEVEVFDRQSDRPLRSADKQQSRFVVHVDPLSTNVVDGDSLNLIFRKKGGSLAPRVKRQYLDSDFSRAPQRVVLMGGTRLEINQTERPSEYADDPRCDLFDKPPSVRANYGRTYVTAGQTFDFQTFKGGELILEDYKGETVPVGLYQMALWEPYYQRQDTEVSLHDRDVEKTTRTSLVRETLPLELETTGPRPTHKVALEGRDTHQRVEVPLDFVEPKEQPGLPVDVYAVTTDVPGIDAWRLNAALLPKSESPPIYDTRSKENKPILKAAEESKELIRMPRLTVKTRLGLSGRLEIFSHRPDPLAADLFIDIGLMKVLDLLLYGQEVRPEEEKRGSVLKAVASTLVGAGPPAMPVAERSPSPSVPSGAGPAPSPGTPHPSGGAPGGQGAPVAEEKKAPPKPELPRDPEELRKLLAHRLEAIDLLVLDSRDMTHLRKSPEVAAVIQRYIASGGSLFAFVSENGNFEDVVGVPLTVEKLSKPTNHFDLAPGAVPGLALHFDKKQPNVKSKRPLPEIQHLDPSWRVVAFTEGRKEPRIIESGLRDKGGYVALWLDDPESFRGSFGGTVPEVEKARGTVEERILQWARFLMYRRFDKSGDQRRAAEALLH